MSETPFVTDYTGPEGLRTRGTVLVVPGRGESEATYRRFGRRLAADSYRVRVLPAPVIAEADLAGSLQRFAAQLADAVAGTGADGPVRPLVLAGSDTGAAAVAALVARSVPPAGTPDVPWWPQALVLAALPGYATHQPGSWDDELDVRTQCSVHRAVLSDDESVPRGTLSPPSPARCSTPPTAAPPTSRSCCWSATPTPSPTGTPWPRPRRRYRRRAWSWCAARTTTSSTTCSTVRWPPRSSRSWKRCATSRRWSPSSRWSRVPGDQIRMKASGRR